MNQHMLKREFLSLVPVVGLYFLIISPAYSATYYVRLDGGTAAQCTGLADAPYPGTGTNRDCAFSHPFWAHAPKDHPTKLKGGDTLIIDGSNKAEYMMGYGAPNGSGTNTCNVNWPFDCFMRPIPSGLDAANPTRILGKGWDAGCKNPPQLWGTERTDTIINMLGSDNVELQCLEITDHSSCQEFGPDNPCNRTTKPYGPWAKNGLRATDSENVLLKNINLHGIAHKGVFAGRLKDWTVEDSRIYANSIVGWDGDVGDFNSSNSGTMTFTNVVLQYSGCGETYPGGQPQHCYSQSQGGYGDGLGTHQKGANWIFNNVDFSHNVSDGLDLLYHDGTGTVTIKRSRFEGNAGNQVKIAANAVIENSIIIGNCNYFNGRSFTSTKSPGFDNCRAGGNALVFAFHPGMKAEFYNSTLMGVGDTVVMSSQRTSCNGTETITSRNNIFLGDKQFGHPDTTDLYYAAGQGGNGDGLCGQIAMNDDYSVIWGTKSISTNCNGKARSYCQDPKLAEPNPHWYNGDQFNVNLLDNSPARDKALVLTGKSSLDYNKFDRGNVWDIGALDYGSVPQLQQQQTCASNIQYCATQQDCEGQGYYWHNNTCNTQPQPKTCVDGIQYCLTQTDCTSNGYYWYNNTCNTQPQPKTCTDGIQHCTTQTDCTNNGHYWYNNTCNALPQPKTCADGIQYCTTQTACEGQSYFWYNNTCNAQPKPKTCADGIQYCATQTACEGQNYFWYNNTCNAQPQPIPTCSDGAQYCKNKPQCTNQGYYWYNNTCNAQPQPAPTCADGIQYCSTKNECEGRGYYWYANSCNIEPKAQPTPQPQQEQKQDDSSPAPTVQTPEPDNSHTLPTTTESIGDNSSTTDISPETTDTKVASVDPGSSQPVSVTSTSDGESQNARTEGSGDVKIKSVDPGSSPPKSLTSSDSSESQNASTGKSGRGGRGGGGGGGGGGGKSSGGSSGSGTSLTGAGRGAGVPTNVFNAPSPVKSTGLPGELSSNLIKGAPQAKPSQSAKGVGPTTASRPIKGEPPVTVSQPTAANKPDSALITPSLHLTDTTSISLTRDDIAAQAEVASEPTVEPEENMNLTKTEGETPLDKTAGWINALWRKILRWFSGG